MEFGSALRAIFCERYFTHGLDTKTGLIDFNRSSPYRVP